MIPYPFDLEFWQTLELGTCFQSLHHFEGVGLLILRSQHYCCARDGPDSRCL